MASHSLLEILPVDILRKIGMKKQIPNSIVYLVLYALVFGISGWLLIFHNENPTNWLLYPLMVVSVLIGLVKFAIDSRKRQQQSA